MIAITILTAIKTQILRNRNENRENKMKHYRFAKESHCESIAWGLSFKDRYKCQQSQVILMRSSEREPENEVGG